MMKVSKLRFWILLTSTLALSLSGCGFFHGVDANAPQMQAVSFTLCASEVPAFGVHGDSATCLDFVAEYAEEEPEVDTGD